MTTHATLHADQDKARGARVDPWQPGVAWRGVAARAIVAAVEHVAIVGFDILSQFQTGTIRA